MNTEAVIAIVAFVAVFAVFVIGATAMRNRKMINDKKIKSPHEM